MLAYERGYRVARFSFVLLALAGWISIVAGIAVAIAGFTGSAAEGSLFDGRNLLLQLASAAPGIGIMVGGLFGIAVAHSGRANVDTAAMTRELLKLAQQNAAAEGEPEAEPLHAPPPPPPSPPARAPQPVPMPPAPRYQDTSARSRQLMLAPVRAPAPEPEREDDVEDEIYRQVKIAARDDGYYIRDRRFESIDDARLFIDRALARAGLKAER